MMPKQKKLGKKHRVGEWNISVINLCNLIGITCSFIKEGKQFSFFAHIPDYKTRKNSKSWKWWLGYVR